MVICMAIVDFLFSEVVLLKSSVVAWRYARLRLKTTTESSVGDQYPGWYDMANRLLEKWVNSFKDSLLKEDSEFDKLFSEMLAAKEQLYRCINFAGYAEMKSAGHSIEAIEKNIDRKERDEILNWLFESNFEKRHVDLLSQVEGRPDAGKWLLNSMPFKNWRKGRSSKLWYTGKRKF